MPYDEDLAERVRAALAGEPALREKRMFGGVAFLVAGNMAVVVRRAGGLMVRVLDRDVAKAEAEPGVEPAVMRGGPMRGWYTVPTAGVASAVHLRRWVARGVKAARALPAK
jgi:TfoX/Sxy family transcriptional regulator of competence genes